MSAQHTPRSRRLRPPSYWHIAVILALHLAGAAGLLLAARPHPAFWGIGLLAYSLGMRHAFDADHIAAIDNTVRKLIQQDRDPRGVGFFFSLGHSTVVFLMVALLGLSLHWLQAEMPRMQAIGSLIGTAVSGSFLLVIGVLNFLILLNLLGAFRRALGNRLTAPELAQLPGASGWTVRWLAPLFRLITRSWHVYPIGFLFGLGFDTASEIALLAISAGAVNRSVPFLGMLSLPVLFAAGMSLLDTADEMLMTRAYRWAFTAPLRKLYYSVTLTALSVAAAIVVGGVELLQVIGSRLRLEEGFMGRIAHLDFGDSDFGWPAFSPQPGSCPSGFGNGCAWKKAPPLPDRSAWRENGPAFFLRAWADAAGGLPGLSYPVLCQIPGKEESERGCKRQPTRDADVHERPRRLSSPNVRMAQPDGPIP